MNAAIAAQKSGKILQKEREIHENDIKFERRRTQRQKGITVKAKTQLTVERRLREGKLQLRYSYGTSKSWCEGNLTGTGTGTGAAENWYWVYPENGDYNGY